jgi:predicted nucleotidyltransferase
MWLFGSRVDDAKRGGDIDLYVESAEEDMALLVRQRLDFLAELNMELGEQKIDVVLNVPAKKLLLPIYEEAKKTGIQLV